MVTYATEIITPQKAEEYLQMNLENRPVSKDTVAIYADMMKRGKWHLNGESITFTPEGELLNGQHRLKACVLAGVPFTSTVTRGIPKEEFKTIDCGRTRKMSQLIGMQGTKHYVIVASTFNMAQALIKGVRISDRNAVKKGAGYTNIDKMELFEQDREGYIEAANAARQLSCGAKLLDVSLVGGCIYYLTKYCGYTMEYVSLFFEQLLSYSTSRFQAIDTLRIRLIKESNNNIGKTHRNVILALLIKTWNNYVTNKAVMCLRFTEEKEDYPEFIKIKN